MRARVILAAVVAAFAFVALASAQPYSITSGESVGDRKAARCG